jgi:hypothetical protein
MRATAKSVVVPIFDFTGNIYCTANMLPRGCLIPAAQRRPQPNLIAFELASTLQTPGGSINFFDPITQPAITPAHGEETVINPWVGGSFEIMSPGLQSLPTRPRFFIHGDVQYHFGVPRSIAREDKPAASPGIGLPPGFRLTYDQGDGNPGVVPAGVNLAFPAMSTLTFPPAAGEGLASADLITGQGTKIEATEEPWIYGAGAGVAFTFELFERRLRVKPSLEYQRRKLTVESTANKAYTSAFVGDFQAGIAPNFNIVQLSATQELDIHGLGPGLEVEMDTWQIGPVMLSVFLQGQAYRALGETSLRAGGFDGAACGNVDGSNLQRVCQQTLDRVPVVIPALPGENLSRQERPFNQALSGLGINDIFGEFSYEIDPWTVQMGVGLRFRAVPEYWLPQALRDFQLAEAPSDTTTDWQAW